ncbi:MAG: hypothetical protein ACJAUA_000641 [Zhongshania aliphaticivorans]|jgi:hypothetical protein
MHKNRALILRSNRFLVSSLLDKKLITNAQMEAANEKFIEAAQTTNTYKNTSILKILLHDLKALDEDRLLSHISEEYKIGLVDLKQIELQESSPIEMDLSLCWATLTVPFDQVDQTFMLATCYYMSSPTLKYWEELLGGKIIWYATSMISVTSYLEGIERRDDSEESTTD